MREIIKTFVVILIFGFFLNLIWEMFHSPLYLPHYKNIFEFLNIHIRVAFNDTLIIFLIYFLIAGIKKNLKWIGDLDKIDILAIIFLGLVISAANEKIALEVNRWSYNQLMPIIPYIEVGLSPILQMMLLPVAVFKIVGQYFK